MITSNDNERLKLVRKLARAQVAGARGRLRHRGRGPARSRARRRLVAARRPRRAGRRDRRGGGRARSARRRLDARLGHPGDRRLVDPGARGRTGRRPSTCTASPTPATSARSSAPRPRSPAAGWCSAPGSADPYSPKAVRATMGALFASPPRRGGPRVHAGAAPGADRGRRRRPRRGDRGARELADALPGIGARGAPRRGDRALRRERHDPPPGPGTESLNVAAAAAIALQRIYSVAAGGATG